MAVSVEIKRLSDNKIFKFFDAEVPNADLQINVKRFKYEEPDGDGTNNLSLNLGTEQTIRFSFKLLDSDESASTTETVKSVSEKRDYLMGIKASTGITYTKSPFLLSGIEDFYLVSLYTHNGNFLNNKVQLDSFNVSPNNQNPNSLTGGISFTIGGGYQ